MSLCCIVISVRLPSSLQRSHLDSNHSLIFFQALRLSALKASADCGCSVLWSEWRSETIGSSWRCPVQNPQQCSASRGLCVYSSQKNSIAIQEAKAWALFWLFRCTDRFQPCRSLYQNLIERGKTPLHVHVVLEIQTWIGCLQGSKTFRVFLGNVSYQLWWINHDTDLFRCFDSWMAGNRC